MKPLVVLGAGDRGFPTNLLDREGNEGMVTKRTRFGGKRCPPKVKIIHKMRERRGETTCGSGGRVSWQMGGKVPTAQGSKFGGGFFPIKLKKGKVPTS